MIDAEWSTNHTNQKYENVSGKPNWKRDAAARKTRMATVTAVTMIMTAR